MESPGGRHTVTGAFLCSAITESGGIVIVYSLPERCDSGNSVISTFCNRDIFAVQQISPRRNVPRNENGNLLPKMGNVSGRKE